MLTRVAGLLVILLGAHCIHGCSVPEATATPNQVAAPTARNREPEQRADDRRRAKLQKKILKELRALADSRGRETTEASSEDYKLLVFGGPSHEVYLGCVCEAHGPDSVFNMAGEFGSDLSNTSMRNKFAPYGSNNEDTSACNVAATHPPSVVGSDGKALGLLTLNASLKKRLTTPALDEWLARMCRL